MNSSERQALTSRGGKRPSSQREGVRTTLPTWRFVTAGDTTAGQSPLATRSESRRAPKEAAMSSTFPPVATALSSGSGVMPALPTPPGSSQSARGRPRPPHPQHALTSSERLPPVPPAALSASSLARTHSSVHTSPSFVSPRGVAGPLRGSVESLQEYAPNAASAEVDLTPSADFGAKVPRPCLSLQSVMNAAVEAAEEGCKRAQPREPQEVARRLLGLPDPNDSVPHLAVREAGSVPSWTPPATAAGRTRRVSPEARERNGPDAARVERPAAVVPASGVDHSDIVRAREALEQRRRARTAKPEAEEPVDGSLALALSTASDRDGLDLGTGFTLTQTVTILEDGAEHGHEQPEQPEQRRVQFAGPESLRSSAPAAKASVRQSPRQSPQGSMTGIAAPQRRVSTRRSTLHSPGAARRGTVASVGSRVSSPGGGGGGGVSSPKGALSDHSTESGATREWVAAGGVSKEDPLYKMMAATIASCKDEFGFRDPVEQRALDNVLLGLQHAHVHRMYGQLHSLSDAGRGFDDGVSAPVNPNSRAVVVSQGTLHRTRRAAVEQGGRHTDAVVPRLLPDAVRAARARKLQARRKSKPDPLADPDATSDEERAGTAGKFARRAPAPGYSDVAAAQRRQAERERRAERKVAAHFATRASELEEEHGPSSTAASPAIMSALLSSDSDAPATAAKNAALARAKTKRPLRPHEQPLGMRPVASLTAREFRELLRQRTAEEPDMNEFETRMRTPPALREAPRFIEDSFSHLNAVMPPEDFVRYQRPTAGPVLEHHGGHPDAPPRLSTPSVY